MTDGTSQGLFIVVSVVIFGIFILLSYILFEDTLSPALANMFIEATEKSQARLEGLTEIDISTLKLHREELDFIVFDFNRNYIDNGEKFPSNSGTFGSRNEDGTYTLDNVRVFSGRETEIEDFFRIFLQQNSEDKEKTPDIIGAKLRINNKEVESELINTLSIDGKYNRWYVQTGSMYLSENTPYTFELWMYTDSNEFLEIKKTVIIE